MIFQKKETDKNELVDRPGDEPLAATTFVGLMVFRKTVASSLKRLEVWVANLRGPLDRAWGPGGP